MRQFRSVGEINNDRNKQMEYEEEREFWMDKRLKEIERLNDILKNPNLDETAKVELNKSITLILQTMNNSVIYIPN